jgi:hypothetical protein
MALAAALVVLDASLTFNNLWPTPGVIWSGELSVEVAACVLALAIAARWLGPPSRTVLAFVAAAWCFSSSAGMRRSPRPLSTAVKSIFLGRAAHVCRDRDARSRRVGLGDRPRARRRCADSIAAYG